MTAALLLTQLTRSLAGPSPRDEALSNLIVEAGVAAHTLTRMADFMRFRLVEGRPALPHHLAALRRARDAVDAALTAYEAAEKAAP
jgi:hypothetical protein